MTETAADAWMATALAADAAARHSYGKLVAFLAARSRDLAGAEDALADAFTAALERWPVDGVPYRPEAWLLAVARRRSIDRARRRLTGAAAADHLRLLGEEMSEHLPDGDLPDERLRLLFVCAHPAIDPGIRSPLMLQTVLGLHAAAIASAFLVPPATMSQRLVRAKARIRDAGIPFRVPDCGELPERLGSVLEAIYAAFAEGWSDPSAGETKRRNLATEGIWLGRLAVSLMPQEPEALGLLALMLFAEARRPARRDAAGNYVPLARQDTMLWNAGLIDEAEGLLRRAGEMGAIGRYQLEAAVQSAHADRRNGRATDWAAIVQLYDALGALSDSPVAAINRAVAVAKSEGAAAALADLDAVGDDQRLAEYQPYWAARADILSRLGKADEAAKAYDRAIGLEHDDAVRRFLQQRQAALPASTARDQLPPRPSNSTVER